MNNLKLLINKLDLKIMSETIYVKGIRLFKKKDNAPEWVLADGVISPKVLNEFLKTMTQYQSDYKGEAQFRIQITAGDKGPSVRLDTYVAQEQDSNGPW